MSDSASTPNFHDEPIAFVGAGNMGAALIGGLIASGHDPAAIRVGEADAARRGRLADDYGVTVDPDNMAAVGGTRLAVLAVKPQAVESVLGGLSPALDAPDAPALLSVAAGIDLASLHRWAGRATEIYRAMPNTPALVGAGITGLTGSAAGPRRPLAEYLMSAVGEVLWLEDEGLFDALTALSGSGPAYVFALTEAMADAGQRLGLAAPVAERLAARTVCGAGELLAASDVDAGELRRRVTSPGGTTAAALEEFERRGFVDTIHAAMARAAARSREINRELGGA